MIKYISILLMLLAMPVLVFSADEKDIYVAEAGPDGVQRVEITAGNYFFKPEHIIVKAGVPVELVVKKESTLIPHNFVIKAAEAGIEFSETLSGSPKTIKFTPALTGKYTFYCDKKLFFLRSHRERGMEGTIEVLE